MSASSSPRPAAISAFDGALAVEPFGQLRQLEIGCERPALAMARAANDVADGFLQHDPEILGGEQIGGPPVRDQSGGSDRGVAGERQFPLRRKDPHARGIDRIPRLEDEHGLGQVELSGDRLHAGVVQPGGVEHDGERIASERRLGEYVKRLKRAPHKRKSRARSAPQTRRRASSIPGKQRLIGAGPGDNNQRPIRLRERIPGSAADSNPRPPSGERSLNRVALRRPEGVLDIAVT